MSDPTAHPAADPAGHPAGNPTAGPTRVRPSPLAWVLIWPIRFYQRFISRYTPPTCRYYPCCSSYAIGALRVHGAAKGLILTAWRLLRCNPWSAGGIDRVPPHGAWRPAPEPVEDPERREPSDRCDTDLSGSAHAAGTGSPIAGRTAA